MNLQRLFTITVLNILGIALFLSWFLPANHGVWFEIDKSIFFGFNHLMGESYPFAVLVALTNFRGFDLVSLLAMGALYFSFWRQCDPEGRCRMGAILITMIITSVLLNQLGHLLPVKHPSPTGFFHHILRAGELTGIPTKDHAGDSFPGDHGIMLLSFTCFMWRYFGQRAGIWALVITLVFSLPRVMAGAHWFTDIAVGSIAIILVGMSWVLLTPLGDKMVNQFTQKLLDRRSRRVSQSR